MLCTPSPAVWEYRVSIRKAQANVGDASLFLQISVGDVLKDRIWQCCMLKNPITKQQNKKTHTKHPSSPPPTSPKTNPKKTYHALLIVKLLNARNNMAY